MLLERFYKLFPVPVALELTTVGLDISDESIKFAELVYGRGGYRLGRYGDLTLPPGTIMSGKIADKVKLTEVLKQVKKENGFDYVHVSLPEEESFVVRMNIPREEPRLLHDSVLLQLEEYIPVPADQVNYDYEIYSEPKGTDGNFKLGVYSAPKELIADYTGVLSEAGLKPASLEIEVQSAARALIPAGDQGTYMIADLGKTRTGFSIVSHGVVMFASTIKSIGGENLTSAVAKALNISFEEAEKVRIKNGLLNSPENKAVFEALLPIASLFKDEISRHFSFWDSLIESHEVGDKISRLICCGGQANLPGLPEYISADLSVPVVIGDPWVYFMDTKKQHPPLPFNASLRYAAAIGLALRGINSHLL